MKIVYPKLTLVGAGPGDPELISLKGVKAIKNADVILYDALTHPDLLSYASENAIIEFVGKRAGEHYLSQAEINRLIVEYAIKHGNVVRLKGGDPFVFGRGHEEIEFVEKFEIDTEVIPGISSATSLSGLLKIPLTRRDINESFWVLTGTTQIENLSKDFEAAIKTNATIVILMGYNKLPQIVKAYKALGKSEQPVAIIQNGSLPDEKVAVGTIETIEMEAKTKDIGTPALILIGEVVGLYQQEIFSKEERKTA